jgi:hypothetical protein
MGKPNPKPNPTGAKSQPYDQPTRPLSNKKPLPRPPSLSSAMDGNRHTAKPDTIATYIKHVGLP